MARRAPRPALTADQQADAERHRGRSDAVLPPGYCALPYPAGCFPGR